MLQSLKKVAKLQYQKELLVCQEANEAAGYSSEANESIAKEHFASAGNASSAHAGDDSSVSLSSNIKALKQEREFLSKRMNSRLTEKELVNKLWMDPNDRTHIEESADIVARLVGFCEGETVAKEMFELNFALPENRKQWLLGWEPNSNFLKL